MVKGATWLRGRYDPNRKPGREGVNVVLLDVSGSMVGAPTATLKAVLDEVMSSIPQIHVVAFSSSAGIIRPSDLIDREKMMKFGGGNCTTGLEIASSFRPDRSVLISDGLIYTDCIKERELAKVDGLTGSLSAVWIGEDRYGIYPNQGRDNLEELARRGGGRRHSWDGTSLKPLADIIRTIAREEPTMAKTPLPDHFFEDDEFEFVRPEAVKVDLRRHYHVITGSVITREHLAPEIREIGQTVRQRIGMEQPNITVTEPKGVISKAISWLTSDSESDVPRSVNRGLLQEAPPQIAPSRGPVLALPAPQREPVLVPQLADRREVALPSAGSIAAKFRR